MQLYQEIQSNATDTVQEQRVLLGIKPISELLQQAPQRIETVFVRKRSRSYPHANILHLCRAAGVPFCLVEEIVLQRLCEENLGQGQDIAHIPQHQGAVARLTQTWYTTWEELVAQTPTAPLPVLLALDQLQDTGNVGTLARTLYALGGAGIVLPKHNSAYLGGVAQKAAAGALEHLPVAQVTNLGHALDYAEEAGLALVGTGSGHGQKQGQHKALNIWHDPLPTPLVLVLGNEGKGMRPSIAKRCAYMAYIPLAREFDSLNVAQAGAIILGMLATQCGRVK